MLTRMFKELVNILILLLPRWEKHSDTIHQQSIKQLTKFSCSILRRNLDTKHPTDKKKKKASEERLSNKPDEGLKASVWHQYDEIRSRLSFPGCDHQIHGGGRCLLCLKQYLGGFYGSRSIRMNTTSWDFQLEHCTVATIDHIHRDPVGGSTCVVADQRIDSLQMEKETCESPCCSGL